jgi:hypothetical protein
VSHVLPLPHRASAALPHLASAPAIRASAAAALPSRNALHPWLASRNPISGATSHSRIHHPLCRDGRESIHRWKERVLPPSILGAARIAVWALWIAKIHSSLAAPSILSALPYVNQTRAQVESTICSPSTSREHMQGCPSFILLSLS